MSGDVFDKDALIRYRLEQARETLLDAKTLYDHERRPASIVNRAYYAMFYATLALLVTVGKSSSKHIGVISFFDLEFVKKNIFPKEMSRKLHEVFEARQEGDYTNPDLIDREKAAEVLQAAEEFLHAIEKKLKN
ncbi:MAG: HEPN domain-containing protein [Chloroflexi bacterium]|nr:HEPN domain-containing protein [Chloroflexota bacterium]MBI3167085.1 HEPN domain-containing protein [Chloroflexota bacterium]